MRSNVVNMIYPPLIMINGQNKGGGALCVEMGFTWTFPRNKDATVKLKFELIFIKF